MAVDHDLVRAIGRDAQFALYDALLKGDVRDKCENYLKEDPSTSHMREELIAKLERLRQAKAQINSL